ncbi:MAG: DUF4411 family protein [Phycisphaerales bacterium]|nr:DUF4411 family protein [Phycisphaerales bacterium]
MAYLIDTDIFIAAKNLHYGMDFCPAFWDWLITANKAGKLMSIDAVRDDLSDGDDELAKWAKTIDGGFFVVPVERDLVAMGQVTQWINDHKTYSDAAKRTFLDCSDYFVVSQALAGGHTVITHEKPENSVHRIKIPSVCVSLKVKYLTPWQMLRIEKARFVLQRSPR